MRDLLEATPVIAFGVLFVFKVIKTFSLKGFFNIGKLKKLSLYELVDLALMSFLAYSSLKYSFKSNFSGLWFEWLQILVSTTILYRFFYMGLSRMLFRNESIVLGTDVRSFFKKRT